MRDAAEYEEQYAGIKLFLYLNREEAMACLKRAHIYKTVGRRAWLETGIFNCGRGVVFRLLRLVSGGYNLALGILSLAVAAAVWLVPYLDMRKRAGEIAGGRKIEVEIYPDEVVVGSGEASGNSLDGTSGFEEFDDLMVLFTPKNAILAMPMRIHGACCYRGYRECSSRDVFPKSSKRRLENRRGAYDFRK